MDADRAMVAEQLIDSAEEISSKIDGVQFLIAGGGNVFDKLKDKSEKINTKLGRKCIVMTGARTDINKIVAAGRYICRCKPSCLGGNVG